MGLLLIVDKKIVLYSPHLTFRNSCFLSQSPFADARGQVEVSSDRFALKDRPDRRFDLLVSVMKEEPQDQKRRGRVGRLPCHEMNE